MKTNQIKKRKTGLKCKTKRLREITKKENEKDTAFKDLRGILDNNEKENMTSTSYEKTQDKKIDTPSLSCQEEQFDANSIMVKKIDELMKEYEVRINGSKIEIAGNES